MSPYLKAWAAAVAALVLAGIQAYQATSGGWTLTNTAVIVLAVLNVAGVYLTRNSDLGLSAHAKAVVAVVIAALIAAATTAQPLTADGLDTADLLTIAVAVLGALGVWSADNGTGIAAHIPALADAGLAVPDVSQDA